MSTEKFPERIKSGITKSIKGAKRFANSLGGTYDLESPEEKTNRLEEERKKALQDKKDRLKKELEGIKLTLSNVESLGPSDSHIHDQMAVDNLNKRLSEIEAELKRLEKD
jgi:uncharacterized protein YabN with tetrapyrrole methylase and pyrophosphatase domain